MFLLQWSIIGQTYNREFGFAKKVYNHTRCSFHHVVWKFQAIKVGSKANQNTALKRSPITRKFGEPSRQGNFIVMSCAYVHRYVRPCKVLYYKESFLPAGSVLLSIATE